MLSPKLVDAGRHQNIKILAQSRIEKVEGEAGNFRITVKKEPRYIIEDKCTGCGECANVCPVERPNPYEEGLANRHAIYRPYAQAIPNVFTITKNERPPCTTTCPVNTNAQGYIALTRQGKFKEALQLIREKNPLPSICGRVCTHPCESECSRGEVDEPIAIKAIKRFLADYELKDGGIEVEPAPRTREEKVAIIGSGPAGLTCAYDLVKLGYEVAIFESLPIPGGMPAVGIPGYRLPKDILQTEIGAIQKLGVEVKLNTTIGKDLTIDDLQKQGYKAIFIAIGAHRSLELGVPGEDTEGVYHGTTFLRDVNLGKEVKIGERTLVVGGGNVAIDSARTALRLGSKEVTIVYRRSREEMPASEEEVEAAEEEGIKIHYLAAPVRILTKDGKVTGMECTRMELGEPDASGRRRPVPIQGSEFIIDADIIIPSIGQALDTSLLSEGKFNIGRRRTFEVNPISLETNIPGIFAGGDAVSGPATVIEAMAAGRRASNSINRYLNAEDLVKDREGEFMTTTHAPLDFDLDKVEKKARQKMPTIPMERRISSFDEVELGFSEEEAVAEAQRCLDCGICSECMQCVEACKANAIDHSQREETIELNVGSIILAPGFDEFEPQVKSEYGYGRFPNVVTSTQFERILSATGPFQGELLRPSDHSHPKKIAFIQCVGSRDISCGNEYCSSICCMYATKEAVIAKEHAVGELESSIFYIDLRAYGKDFDKYIIRAENEHGVRFIRSRIASIEEVPQTRNLTMRYETDEGELKDEEFDMVILSVGVTPSHTAHELAEKFGIDLNEYGFCKTNEFSPLETSVPGIFVCGTFQSPRDIPETVMQASGAASEAEALLYPERGSLVVERVFPPEIDVTGQEPRIGAFICNCGINIAGYVDVPAIVEYAKTLPYVVYAEDNLYTCSQDTQERIKDAIKEHKLNRVVVASCTPRTHEPLFQATIREAGLNKYLFEMANIRDQCSWVHMNEPKAATQKAKDLVRMAVAKASLIEPLAQQSLSVIPRGLVIGGGLAGMTAALALANQGFGTYLIESEKELGGNLRKVHYTLESRDVQGYLKDLIERVNSNKLIRVFTDAEIKGIEGFVGNFKTTISVDGKDEQLEHGAIIVATGAQELKTNEYLYGEDPRVVTQLELEERIVKQAEDIAKVNNIVMIQCVGSREEGRQYCSRICCTHAIKNALKIKELNPSANIFILYRDMRTYGFKEKYYREAREKGVIFVRYDADKKPRVETEDGRLRVWITDPIIQQELLLDPDLLVLSVGIVPQSDSRRLAEMLKVPLNEDNFFLEAHVKLRPVDFATEGVFLCGLAHSPKLIDESIAQADAAVSRASTILSKENILAEGIVASVDEDICSGCGICEVLCPYGAITINKERKVAEVNAALCKGCGTCCAACPSGAAQQRGFRADQISHMVEAALAV
jgi:homotetrameric NADPH-dependent glutamate synthase